MKKLRKLTALALVLCMMLVMAASCGGSGYVIKVGERTVSEAMYENTAKSYKSNFLTSYGMESATDAELSEIWDQYTDENQTSTVGDYLDSAVQNYLITNMLFSNQFDKLGLTLSDETISEIELEVEQMANQAGGLESLRDTLMEVNGITYEEFVDQYYDSAKRTAVVQYYFGENGAEHPVSEQEIADYSLQFPLLALNYYYHTHDSAYLSKNYEYCQRLIRHFQKFARQDGLLTDVTDKWNLVDWPENMRDNYDFELTNPILSGSGCHNVINAFYIGSVMCTEQIAEILGLNI